MFHQQMTLKQFLSLSVAQYQSLHQMKETQKEITSLSITLRQTELFDSDFNCTIHLVHVSGGDGVVYADLEQ